LTGFFPTPLLLYYQRNKQASPSVSSYIPAPPHPGLEVCMPLPQQPLSAPLGIQTCKLYRDFIFSLLGVTLLKDLFRDKATPLSTYLHNPSWFCAGTGHPQPCLCPQAAWQSCPNLADLCPCFR